MNNVPNLVDDILIIEENLKLEIYKNENNLNYLVFKINKEDHTIGDLLQTQLLKIQNVVFSGYKKNHPLENYITLKIITNGTITPIEALDRALKDLYIEFSLLEENLDQS